MLDDGRIPIAIGHLSGSGDLKMKKKLCNFQTLLLLGSNVSLAVVTVRKWLKKMKMR